MFESRIRADFHCCHFRFDGNAQLLLADPIIRQELALSLGRAAAMAPHGCDHEGMRAPVAQGFQSGTYND